MRNHYDINLSGENSWKMTEILELPDKYIKAAAIKMSKWITKNTFETNVKMQSIQSIEDMMKNRTVNLDMKT
jgi:hypothetical protein